MSGKGIRREILFLLGCIIVAWADVVLAGKIYEGTIGRTEKVLEGVTPIPEKVVGNAEIELPETIEVKMSEVERIRNLILTMYPAVNKDNLIKYQAMVDIYSKKYGFDSEFILALIAVESKFNPTANSYLGAEYGRGLMQISEIALEEYNNWHYPEQHVSIEMLYLPYINIQVGCWTLAHNRDHYKVPSMGIDTCTAYNMGPTAWRNGDIAEAYTAKVLTRYEYLLGN